MLVSTKTAQHLAAWVALGLVASVPRAALAADPPAHDVAPEPAGPSKVVVVWPTLTPAGDDASPVPLHKPTSLEEPLATRAHELDATLRDATQDLGFVLDLDDTGPAFTHVRDLDMVARAKRPRLGEPSAGGSWVVSARLEPLGGDSYLLCIVVVPPNSSELRTRVEVVKGAEVSLRGLVMLRDLLSPREAALVVAPQPDVNAAPKGALVTPSRSPGRAVLAANGALFGGFVGYSLVRSTGSNDPRVLYPLLTLGSAVGIGAGLLAAEEWDVSTGDAWFLSAGAWWGAGAGLLIATGTNAEPAAGPYAVGIGGGLAGAALATFALTRAPMDDGDAILTHSGAALGAWVGALSELGYRGTTSSVTPYTGAGIGSAVGLVGAGATSIFVTIAPSRVLLLDLGAGLGSLAGAAVGSPLIFSGLTNTPTNGTKTRIFLAGTLTGTAVGGVTAWFLTREPPPKKSAWWVGAPNAGIIGQSSTRTGQVPVYGVSYAGAF